MNHAPPSILRWVRRALIVYSLHFLVAYIVISLIHRDFMSGGFGYTPIVAIMVLIQMAYEFVASRTVARKSVFMATAISLGFALLQTFVAAELTGVYKSPFFIAAIILVFISASLGYLVASATPFILLIGFALGLAGFFNDETNVPLGLTVLGASILSAGAGYLFWRRFYVNPNNLLLNDKLQEEQAKSGLIISSIEDGVVLIDEHHVVQLFNPAAQKISGWPAEDLKGLDFKSVLKFQDEKGKPYEEQNNPFRKVFDTGRTIRDNTAVLVSRDKKPIAVTVTASPLLDPTSKKVNGVVGIIRDASKERSQEKRSADFVSTASHEMRTPVAAIEGYLALALNDRVSTIDSKAREYLEKAHESTQHLGKLFQDLLTSTKAEDGRLSNHPTVVEMGGFIEKVVEDLRFPAEKKGLGMNFVLGTQDNTAINATAGAAGSSRVIKPFYYVNVDPDRLREVITNLFDNAIKYTESGTITIGLTGNNDVVQVSVKDTGPGIPATDVPHLFQKFYRVDNSATRTTGGTGLGLFICKKIVELYNGRIWVESQLGKGSTFFINLPRLRNDQAKQLQTSQAGPSVTPLPTGQAS